MLSPFITMRAWNLYNIENDDLVLIEPPGAPEEPVALDYIDYSGTPILNRECNIALEQQEANLAQYQEGVSGSGFFSPDDDQNADGTYKRLIFDQMEKAFYNKYRNPLKIFGMENIDFPLDRTVRNLGNRFLMFTIPREMMGDRLVAGTIQMYDANLDDNVNIYDDRVGNLFAGANLFSKVQEVRALGNLVLSGSVSSNCVVYTEAPIGTPTITAVQTGDEPAGNPAISAIQT